MEMVYEKGLYTISGNHRRAALIRLAKRFPNNANFKTVPVYILACDDTPDNRAELLMLGSATNDIDHFANVESFRDRMLALRREDMTAMEAKTDSDKKNRLKKVKRGYARIWGYAEPTMGTHVYGCPFS